MQRYRGISFSCTRKNQCTFLVYFLFVIFTFFFFLSIQSTRNSRFWYKRRGTRGRSFTLFTVTPCVDNNLLFLTSAGGCSTHGVIVQIDFYPLLSQFFSRVLHRLLNQWYSNLSWRYHLIVMILCLSQLILSGTAFRSKCFISKCACLRFRYAFQYFLDAFHRMIMLEISNFFAIISVLLMKYDGRGISDVCVRSWKTPSFVVSLSAETSRVALSSTFSFSLGMFFYLRVS